MINPNNQNYFPLEEPTMVVLPWWKQPKVQMRFLAGFGILVGLGLIGYYGYKTYTLTYVDVAKVEQAKTIIANADQACAADPDPVVCKARAQSGAARTTGLPSVCEGLTDKKLTNCVTLIAFDKIDPAVCSQLTGEDEANCVDRTTLLLANKNKDYSLCATITDASVKTSCQAQLVSVVITAGECDKYKIDAATCDYPGKLATVIASGDLAGCNQFPSSQKDGCLDAFSSLDQDQDGLSLLEEFKLGTSDIKADTDGDGYTDAQEVATGNNPLL